MKTSIETAEDILDKISQVADARIKPMMGGYILYVNEKVIGQINEGELFIKVTNFGESYATDLERRPPYDGAKLAFVLPKEKLDDRDWLNEFIEGSVEQLPAPKKK